MSDDYMPKPEYARPKGSAYLSQSLGLRVMAVVCVILSIPAVLFLPAGIFVLSLGLAGIIWGVSRCLDVLGEIRQSLNANKPQGRLDQGAQTPSTRGTRN